MTVAGDPAAAELLERELLSAGAAPQATGPVEYVFYVSSPRAGLDEAEIARLLERVELSGGRLRHICVVREPARPEPTTPGEVRPLVVEDGLRYLAGLHGVPLARVSAPLDGEGGAWRRLALRAAGELLSGELSAGVER